QIQETLQTIEFPILSRDLDGGVESDEEEFETQSIADSVDSDKSSTITVDTRDYSAQKTQQIREQPALPTPEDTPARTGPTPEGLTASGPQREIIGDLD